MYGIVNKAIQGLLTENYGEEKWMEVKNKSGVKVDAFLSNEPYPDEYTFKLALAASEVLETSLENVLIAFGEYWVLKTGMDHYGSLMKAGGSDIKSFLVNLPNFHSRVMLIYPKLTPPEFKITDISDNNLKLHYFSTRSGLTHFVVGLISGLGKMFKEENINIDILQTKNETNDHDIFLVRW